MLKKLIAMALTLALAVTLVACDSGSGDGATNPPASNPDGGEGPAVQSYDWKLSHEENPGEAQDVYAQKLRELLIEKSDGNIQIDIYPVGQLGDSTNLVELIQQGAVEFAINNPGSTSTIIPEANVFSMHFLMPDDIAVLEKIAEEGEGFSILNERYYDNGMTVIDWFPTGFNAWTANKPLLTPDDFNGVKFRTMAAPAIARSYEAYGANAVAIPYTELYSALQLGMADGQVNPLYGISGMKFYEVQEYLMLSSPDCFFSTFVSNNAYWSSLPEDTQNLVISTSKETDTYFQETQESLNAESLRVMTDHGIEIIELSQEQRNAFKAIAEQNRNIYIDLAGDSGQEILDALNGDLEKFAG